MKRLSITLKWVTILFFIRIIYLIILQIRNIISIDGNQTNDSKIFGIEFPENINQTWLLLSNIFILLLLIYISYNIFILIKVTVNLNKNLVFVKNNTKQLKQVAISIIIFASCLIIIETPLKYHVLTANKSLIESNSYYKGYAFGLQISKRLFLFIISIFILIISSLIKKGEIIKQENDLTI